MEFVQIFILSTFGFILCVDIYGGVMLLLVCMIGDSIIASV